MNVPFIIGAPEYNDVCGALVSRPSFVGLGVQSALTTFVPLGSCIMLLGLAYASVRFPSRRYDGGPLYVTALLYLEIFLVDSVADSAFFLSDIFCGAMGDVSLSMYESEE